MAFCSQHVVEPKIACGHLWLLAAQYKMHVHAMRASIGGHHATKVGLVSAHGQKGVALGTQRVGNQEVEQHSIQDQIAARDAVGQQTAVTKKHRGLYFTKLVPPGGG